MGQFKNEGNPFDALAEECAEVIQVIAKFNRFGGNWDDIPPTHDRTRKEALLAEIADIEYQIARVKHIFDMMDQQQQDDMQQYLEDQREAETIYHQTQQMMEDAEQAQLDEYGMSEQDMFPNK